MIPILTIVDVEVLNYKTGDHRPDRALVKRVSVLLTDHRSCTKSEIPASNATSLTKC